MTQPIDLKRLERHGGRYWGVDGLPELVMGGLWMAWGGAWLAGQFLSNGRFRGAYWAIAPVLLAFTVGARWIIRRLKTRITFPRAGYVEWKLKSSTPRQRLVAACMGLLVVAATVVLIADPTADWHWIPPLAAPWAGAVIGFAFIITGVRQRSIHLLVLAAAALALGLLFSALNAGWNGLNWLLLVIGMATTIVGALRLRDFLIKNPIERQA